MLGKNSVILELSNITKDYYIGTENELSVLKNVSLKVHKGEFISIVGPSGSGKSTFMNIIGALDRPTTGTYTLNASFVQDLEDDELSEIRNQEIGFVFQNFNLIPRCSALKNVELPMFYKGIPSQERTKRAKELLEIVGMGHRMHHTPNELSGGQKQRVAIARALANDPAIILADEPTGALDSKTGNMIMDLFLKINKEEGKTIVLITHSNELAEQTERVVTIADGQIISDKVNENYGN